MKNQHKLTAAMLCLLLTGCGSIGTTELSGLIPISEGYVRVPDGWESVPLYAQPDSTSAAVAELHMNDPLRIYSLNNKWFSVESGTSAGFLYGDYVAFSEISEQETSPAAETSAAAADTAPAEPAQTDPASAEPPAETLPSEIKPSKPGELFISEQQILAEANITYSGHTLFSAFPDGIRCSNCTGTVRKEQISEEYSAQRGIDVTYQPGEPWIHIEGFLQLYSWEWANEPGGDITIRPEGEQIAVYLNIQLDG